MEMKLVRKNTDEVIFCETVKCLWNKMLYELMLILPKCHCGENKKEKKKEKEKSPQCQKWHVDFFSGK